MTRTQRFTLVATSLGLFMIFLDALIVNVALPAIQSDFKVGESGLQWVVTAYSLGMTIAIMSAGTAADIYGRRKLYFAGIALFTAASVACGMASSLEVLNLARGVQGVAAATVNVTSLALVSAAFPDPKLKAWAIGIWTAIASTAIAIGPTLGGFMVQQTGWPSNFNDLRLSADVQLTPHPLDATALPNFTVENVVAPRRVYDAKKTRVLATIAGFNNQKAVRNVSLILNGRVIDSKQVTVPEHGRATVEFMSLEAPYGRNKGEVRIDTGDSLAADDAFYFSVEGGELRKAIFV